MTDKIINTFQQRRHLADAIKAMADLASARELILAARSIARTYPAPLLTSAVLNELDTENGHIRGGLGHICSLMPADEIGPALQAVVSDRRRSAHARITAANILERNLGRQAPAASMQDLVNTNDVALQSLREAIEVSHHNPHVLLDYVTQMRATEAEIAFMVLELLHQFSIADQLPLLQLIAQDDRPEVAVAAIERLDQLVTSDADDPAHRALHTLQFVSAPPIDQQVKRMLRKHQFSGRRLRLPAPEGWRALISPIDGAGRQLIWFLHTTVQMPNDGTILVFALNLPTGIESCYVARAQSRRSIRRLWCGSAALHLSGSTL